MEEGNAGRRLKVRVYHDYYGCETGCCGHVVEIGEDDYSRFEFDHPVAGDLRAWARQFAEGVIRASWPKCLDSIDWDSLEVDDVRYGGHE